MSVNTCSPEYREFLDLDVDIRETGGRELLTKTLLEVQCNNKKVGKLVDDEGYPRNDVPVMEIRQYRNQVSTLTYDYKIKKQQMQDLIEKIHASAQITEEDRAPRPPSLSCEPQNLAVVSGIEEGSPSYTAGLREGDIIVELGSVNAANFNSIQDLHRKVKESLNTYMKIVVRRSGQLKRFNLKPKLWSKNDIIGCQFLPIQK